MQILFLKRTRFPPTQLLSVSPFPVSVPFPSFSSSTMAFPYSFPEQAAPQSFNAYYEETKPVIHLELDMAAVQHVQDEPSPNLMQAFQPPRPFTAEQSFLPSFPSSNSLQLFDDYGSASPILWDCHPDQDSFNGNMHSSVHSFASSDLAYSPIDHCNFLSSSSPLHQSNHSLRHHASFPSSENTYTRMFRGRKSKSAAEVRTYNMLCQGQRKTRF